MAERLRLGILASHTGSNMRAVVSACQDGTIAADVALVISNNSDSGALAWAREQGLPTAHLSGATHPDHAALDAAIRDALQGAGVGLVLLLGYMKLLGPQTIRAFPGRILNIHPGPLPRFGGQGLYGMAVHRAVIAAGVAASAVTIHQVDEVYDHGAVVAVSPVPVKPGDTPESLAARVLEEEHRFIVETVARAARGDLPLGPLP
jgi:phosphoribosylglycinamide formyltransferase-1